MHSITINCTEVCVYFFLTTLEICVMIIYHCRLNLSMGKNGRVIRLKPKTQERKIEMNKLRKKCLQVFLQHSLIADPLQPYIVFLPSKDLNLESFLLHFVFLPTILPSKQRTLVKRRKEDLISIHDLGESKVDHHIWIKLKLLK